MLKVVVGVLAVAALTGAAAPRTASRPSPGSAAFVLLADNVVLKLRAPAGRVEARRRLGARPGDRLTDPRRALAVDPGRSEFYALVPGARGQPDTVVVVSTGRLVVRSRLVLDRRIRYRGLVLARRSGRSLLYVFGNEPGVSEGGVRPAVSVLEVFRGRVDWFVDYVPARPAQGYDWWVYWAALSRNEEALGLTYHGVNTTGADLLDLEDPLFPGACEPRPGGSEREGCTGIVHGAIEPYRDGFLAATGSSSLVELDRRGEVVRRLPTGLARNHLMNFALDEPHSVVYVVGSCRYVAGLRAIDLRTGAVRVLARTGRRAAPCGDRSAVVAGGLLLIGTGGGMVFRTVEHGVRIVDVRSGRTLRTVRTAAPVLDILPARG